MPLHRAPSVVAVAVAALGAGLGVRAAAADVVTLKDGRVVEAEVVREGDVVRLVSRFGDVAVPAADVASIEAGQSVETMWRARSAALAAGDHAGRAELAAWLVAAGRATEGRALAEQVVAADPENARAHELLGHVRHRGAWMAPDDAKRADGLEQHGDAWYTPEEWAALGAAEQAKVDAAAKAATLARVTAAANEAARLMVAPDAALRAEGRRRLEALAKETRTEGLGKAAEQLAAFAAATDRYMAALKRGDSATVLAECRIQMAKLKRPIQVFQTSLSSNLGGSPVSIQLPELEVVKVSTTVPIPAEVK